MNILREEIIHHAWAFQAERIAMAKALELIERIENRAELIAEVKRHIGNLALKVEALSKQAGPDQGAQS